MDLKDFCLTDSYLLNNRPSSGFPLDRTMSFSPPRPVVPLDSPASESDSSSYGLFSRAHSMDPGSPDNSSSSGTSAISSSIDTHVNGMMQFSTQVDSVLRYDHLVAPKRCCLVCGDFASGFHYGVASCEACKAFFKRTIQGNVEYSCPMIDQCEITKRRRKACQSCRFHKCLQAGMMREGVRLDRVRGGRQRYKRRVNSELWQNVEAPYTHPVNSSNRNKVISHLLVTDPAPLAANEDKSTNDRGLRCLLTLCDLLNRQLLLLIGWAKHIPGFSELSLEDQTSLVQSGWMEALLVGVAWRSQASGEELVFAENLRLDKEQCGASGLADLYEVLRHLSSKYHSMKLTQEEVVALRAVALANSDAEPVDGVDSVQWFRDSLHEALQDYESQQHRGDPHRAGRLLMSLPLLRQAADLAALTLLRLHHQHHVPLHRLLLEMLEAKA